MAEVKTLIWLLKRIKRRVPALVLLMLVNAGSAILSVFFAVGSKRVINGATSGIAQQFKEACLWQLILIVSLIICLTVSKYLSTRLSDDLDRDWKRGLLRDLLQGEYAAVSKYHSGELINRLNNDVRIVNDGIVGAFPSLVSLGTRLVAAAATLFAMEPEFTLALLGLGVVAVIVTGIVRKWIKNLHRKTREADGRVLSFLQESVEKLMVVQAMDIGKQVEKRSDELLRERYHFQRRRRRFTLLSSTSVRVMVYTCSFGALVWCGGGLLQGTMDFGTLTAVTQLVSQLQMPFSNLSGFLPRVTAMFVSADRIRELEQLPKQEEAVIEDVDACYQSMTGFEAKGLTFAYDEENILEDVSFRLPKGAFAAITGASGIGKSTLLKLMLGVYTPQSGSVALVQADASQRLGRGARGLFAYVPQGNFLFSGTIRDNLLMIRENATEQELNEAIYVSAMDKFMDQLPDGLDTVIGEHGGGLSEGQAQRVSIARAILSGAPVLLLDEATSALDSETETQVLQRIFAMKNRTCIAVTHRPAALEQADHQLCVENKKITVVKLKG